MTLHDTEDAERAAFFAQMGHELSPEDEAERDAYLDALLEGLAERKREAAKNEAVADVRKGAVDRWLEQQNARLEREAFWLEQQIKAVTANYDFGRKKSRELPHGTFGLRTHPGKVEIVDEDRALAFARQHNAVRTKEELDKRALADLVKGGMKPDAGEIGWGWIAPREEFYAKPSLED